MGFEATIPAKSFAHEFPCAYDIVCDISLRHQGSLSVKSQNYSQLFPCKTGVSIHCGIVVKSFIAMVMFILLYCIHSSTQISLLKMITLG